MDAILSRKELKTRLMEYLDYLMVRHHQAKPAAAA